MDSCFEVAVRLHRYLLANHWRGQALIGPDPGIRFNYRVGRFVKGYMPALPWNDDYYYLQAQGYWLLANWHLHSLTGEEAYREIAVRCSDEMLARQRSDGAWEYPNREWKGRIATAEGTWGSLGLVESFRWTGSERFLEGALRWHLFLADSIGFQRRGAELAVNYFANRKGPRVPNNTAFVLRFLAELAGATGDSAYLEPCEGLLTFMRTAQAPTGEFPYSVEGETSGKQWSHFQCYQYNAFQCLDLMRYLELTGDAACLPLISGVLGFLATGIAEDGHAFYECGNRHGEVTYHTAVLAAAFHAARRFGLAGYDHLADRAYSYLLGRQRPDGGFSHSRRDYRLLSDHRPYPRYLAMITCHLLLREAGGDSDPLPVLEPASSLTPADRRGRGRSRLPISRPLCQGTGAGESAVGKEETHGNVR